MSLTITKRELITRSLRTLGISGQGETPSAADVNACESLLDEFVDSLNIEPGTILTINRALYDLVNGQGGPDNPYTYGPGGDWDTLTQPRPPSIQDANLYLNQGGAPPVRIPLAILTTDMTAATPTPTLLNALPVSLYFNDTVPLAQVVLWPIPTNDVNQIELWTPVVTPAFVSLSAAYVCAPGYVELMRLGLCEKMLTEFAVPVEIAARIPSQALAAFIRVAEANLEMSDVSVDPAFTPQQHGSYVIQTDQGA